MQPEKSHANVRQRHPRRPHQRSSVIGEFFVVWDGNGLVVKGIEPVPGAESPKLRLLSDNPAYEPCNRRADEVHIVGKEF